MLLKDTERSTWLQQQIINDCLSLCLNSSVSLTTIEWLKEVLNYELPDLDASLILSSGVKIINYIIDSRLEGQQVGEIINDVRELFGCHINEDQLPPVIQSWLNLGSLVSCKKMDAIFSGDPKYEEYQFFSELWKIIKPFEELEAPLPRNWDELSDLVDIELPMREFKSPNGEPVLRKL